MNLVPRLCMVLAFAGTALTGAALSAQAITLHPLPLHPPAAHPSSITFDVTVTDKAGHPVTGLSQSDFTVLDNGKPAAVQAFAQRSVAGDPVSALIVIDAVNASFIGSSLAVTQIEDFLRRQSEPLPFPAGIALLTDTGLVPLGPASSNGKLLLAQLSKQGGRLRILNRSQGFWGAEERMEISVTALARIANLLSTQPGRKLVIWVSPGWPVFDNPSLMLSVREQRIIFTTAVQLSEELREGHITICNVDPLGTWDAGTFRTMLWKSYVRPLRRWEDSQPGDLALQVIAQQSGGLVLNSSNDVAGEVQASAQDNAAWYSIRLAPQTSEKPDTWRSVTIRLDKRLEKQLDKPGLIVRTRPGYYAQPPLQPNAQP